MTITIELPKNKREAAFILKLFQKLNLVVKKQEVNSQELPNELVQLLEERLIDLKQNPDNVIPFEEVQKNKNL